MSDSAALLFSDVWFSLLLQTTISFESNAILNKMVSKSSYSVRTRQNTDQKKLRIGQSNQLGRFHLICENMVRYFAELK